MTHASEERMTRECDERSFPIPASSMASLWPREGPALDARDGQSQPRSPRQKLSPGVFRGLLTTRIESRQAVDRVFWPQQEDERITGSLRARKGGGPIATSCLSR